MNGYLLLENGITYDCAVTAEHKNILGLLTQTKAGVNIRCCTSGDEVLISSESSNYQIDASDINALAYHTKTQIKGKIVVDSLPVEYHLHDLKTNFN